MSPIASSYCTTATAAAAPAAAPAAVPATASLSARFVATMFCSPSPASAPGHASGHVNGYVSSDLSPSCLDAFADNLLPALFPHPTVALRSLDSAERPRVVEATVALAAPHGLPSSRPEAVELVASFERAWHVELVFQHDTVFRRHKRLAVFDMDSTLIQQEAIDEIARKLGVEQQVAAITARAMNGDLDFTKSLRARCALLKGAPATVLDELRDVLTITPGAADLVRALKTLGYTTAVLSGGFSPLTSWLAEQLGLDYHFANHLVVSKDGRSLTGELAGEIVDAQKKRDHVMAIAAREGILLEQVLVVGDGANDLPMMSVAGLGVAFNAKPKVQLAAPAKLNSSSLLDVLYLLGFSASDREDLLSSCP